MGLCEQKQVPQGYEAKQAVSLYWEATSSCCRAGNQVHSCLVLLARELATCILGIVTLKLECTISSFMEWEGDTKDTGWLGEHILGGKDDLKM